MNASADIKTNIKNNVLAVPLTAVAARDKEEDEDDNKGKSKAAKKDEENIDPITSDELQEIVFVLKEDGSVERRQVQTGIQDINNIEIISGLKAGEQVVTAPYNAVTKTLKSGTKVKVVAKEKLFDK
jgi:HlyD family secretion protein